MSVATLTARALVSIEDARRYVYRDEDDTSRDEILIDAVNLVSSSIETHCEREFAIVSGTPIRTFPLRRKMVNGADVGWIDLAPYDLRSATVVKLYTDLPSPSQQTLTADEYRLRPVGGALGGTYLEILTVELTAAEEQPGFEWEATVTGSWGMAAVPDDVQSACLQWIDNIVKNPGSFSSNAMSGYVVTPEVDFTAARAGMPPAVRHRLHPYRRLP
jgi:hypothetical protein